LNRNVRVSDASEVDTLHLIDVLDRGNSSRDFWADRGYHDKPRERWLKLNGWRPHIQRKGQAGKPIGAGQAPNKRIAAHGLGSSPYLPVWRRWVVNDT
jgi:IS5 family transposase